MPFDVYRGFNLYRISKTVYVATNNKATLTANTEHDIYALVMLHTI